MRNVLKFLSEARLAELRTSVTFHRERYMSGDFLDLARENGWAIESSVVAIDYELLSQLDTSSQDARADLINSRVVYEALPGMTPALAREERVWTRLTHVECLEYARARWLGKQVGDALDKAVLTHMFAPTLTGVRDDNALSRLWWNMHIAHLSDPEDPFGALGLIAGRADIRMQFVERSRTAARQPLARAIVRRMRLDKWLTSGEANFREFMKELNRAAGGVLFEALDATAADTITSLCVERARAAVEG